MKEKIREKIIELSHNELIETIYEISLVLIVGVLFKLNMNYKTHTTFTIVWVCTVIIITMMNGLTAIKKQDERTVEKNRLSDIIFSDTKFWLWILLVIYVLIKNSISVQERNLLVNIVMIGALILTFPLSKILSNYFRKQLK